MANPYLLAATVTQREGGEGRGAPVVRKRRRKKCLGRVRSRRVSLIFQRERGGGGGGTKNENASKDIREEGRREGGGNIDCLNYYYYY